MYTNKYIYIYKHIYIDKYIYILYLGCFYKASNICPREYVKN